MPLLYGTAELTGRMGRLELEKAEPASSVVVEGDAELEPEPDPASSVVEGAVEALAVWD